MHGDKYFVCKSFVFPLDWKKTQNQVKLTENLEKGKNPKQVNLALYKQHFNCSKNFFIGKNILEYWNINIWTL